MFCSYHSLLDPSSGAAHSARELLHLLAQRGWRCQALCGPHLDFHDPPPWEQLLRQQGWPFTVRRFPAGSAPFALYHVRQGTVPIVAYALPTTSRPVPSAEEGAPFLALVERILDRFRPDLLLTYGGHWLARAVRAAARRRRIPVVFFLCNLDYRCAETFTEVEAVLVPSAFARDHYQRTLGLHSTALPGPFDWSRVHCPHVEGRYVTFVNPQPAKGIAVFARIAQELSRRRPDLPLLVVTGRAGANALEQPGLDLRGLNNVHLMALTADPRAFYRVSRLLLVPSLCQEAFGRVAAEGLLNGIPVLASRRGGLSEALAEAGFLFDVPARYTPEAGLVPSVEEVAPWVDTILRLWEDPAFYARERQRCLAAADAWRPERLLPRFEAFFTSVLQAAGQAVSAPGSAC